MLEDLIYKWKDLAFVVIVAGVAPGMLLYAAIRILRQPRESLPDKELWGVGILLFLVVALPVVALLLYFDVVWEGHLFTAAALCVVPGLLTIAMITKYLEIRAARSWPQATATVVTSRVETHHKKPSDLDYDMSDTEIANVPLVEYDYTVNQQTFRCGRITIGERTSDYELESILDRYPVGAQVIAYYNPANPSDAVLEREFPPGTWWIGGGCLVMSIALPLGAIWVYNVGLAWFGGGAIVLGAMALATLGLAIALTAMSVQASRWPIARGRIVSADTVAFYPKQGRGWRTHFKATIVYVYEVNGRQYHGDRVRLSAVFSSTIPWLARRAAAKYAIGSEVDVHYNPQKPTESVLHPWSLSIVLPWMFAAGLFALTWFLAASISH